MTAESIFVTDFLFSYAVEIGKGRGGGGGDRESERGERESD